MPHRLTAIITLVLTIVMAGGYSHSQSASGPARNIAIVAIDQDATSLRTIKGIKKAIRRSDFNVTYEEVLLTGDPKADAKIMNDIKLFDPHLFITIGSFATSTTARFFPSTPIVFATVMNPVSSGFVTSMHRPGGNITGAALDIPPEIQFKYFERVVGNIRTMGVMYSSETENIVRQAEVAARQLGIELVSRKVSSEKDIPEAIDSLCQVADALWSVADHNIYTPYSTRHIILQTLRYRIPLMGFSRTLVEAGGLFTLDFDFKDIGRQAGEIATRVLAGSQPGNIPVATPGAGVIYFKYNENTAHQIDLQIPEELLAIAKEVIK